MPIKCPFSGCRKKEQEAPHLLRTNDNRKPNRICSRKHVGTLCKSYLCKPHVMFCSAWLRRRQKIIGTQHSARIYISSFGFIRCCKSKCIRYDGSFLRSNRTTLMRNQLWGQNMLWMKSSIIAQASMYDLWPGSDSLTYGWYWQKIWYFFEILNYIIISTAEKFGPLIAIH